MESQESYTSLFEDKGKYNAVMGGLAGVLYREMQAGCVGLIAEARGRY